MNAPSKAAGAAQYASDVTGTEWALRGSFMPNPNRQGEDQ
jgi:hypothetical protein